MGGTETGCWTAAEKLSGSVYNTTPEGSNETQSFWGGAGSGKRSPNSHWR